MSDDLIDSKCYYCDDLAPIPKDAGNKTPVHRRCWKAFAIGRGISHSDQGGLYLVDDATDARLYTDEINMLREKSEGLAKENAEFAKRIGKLLKEASLLHAYELTKLNRDLAKHLKSALGNIEHEIKVSVKLDSKFHLSDGFRDATKFIADAREALARVQEE